MSFSKRDTHDIQENLTPFRSTLEMAKTNPPPSSTLEEDGYSHPVYHGPGMVKNIAIIIRRF